MIIAFHFRLRGTSGSAFLSGDTKTSLLLQVKFSQPRSYLKVILHAVIRLEF